MGVTTQGFKQLANFINVHYRRMIRAPIHLAHEPIIDYFNILDLNHLAISPLYLEWVTHGQPEP